MKPPLTKDERLDCVGAMVMTVDGLRDMGHKIEPEHFGISRLVQKTPDGPLTEWVVVAWVGGMFAERTRVVGQHYDVMVAVADLLESARALLQREAR